MKTLFKLAICTATFAASCASATVLTSTMRVDDMYSFYLSTDDQQRGVEIGSFSGYQKTKTWTATLGASSDYYLHIHAKDSGAIAGFLGQFSLSDTGFAFVNGTQSLLTNAIDWNASTSAFGTGYMAPTVATTSQVSHHWPTTPLIQTSAQWIWAGDNVNVNQAYFSTKISAVKPAADVPEPGSLALLGLGLVGVALAARRRRD